MFLRKRKFAACCGKAYARRNFCSCRKEIFYTPELTIRARCEEKYAGNNRGPSTILCKEEEDSLVKWIFICAN